MHNISLEEVKSQETKMQPASLTGISKRSEDRLPLVNIAKTEKKWLIAERKKQVLKWICWVMVLLFATGATSFIGYSIICKLEENHEFLETGLRDMKNELTEIRKLIAKIEENQQLMINPVNEKTMDNNNNNNKNNNNNNNINSNNNNNQSNNSVTKKSNNDNDEKVSHFHEPWHN